MRAAVIKILFLTQKSQMFLTVSLQTELSFVSILFIICTPTWLSQNILTYLFWKYVLKLPKEKYIASNSLQLIWTAFSFIFQAQSISFVSKFALQTEEYQFESQKILRSIEGKVTGFSMLLVFSSHHSSSCFSSGHQSFLCII